MRPSLCQALWLGILAIARRAIELKQAGMQIGRLSAFGREASRIEHRHPLLPFSFAMPCVAMQRRVRSVTATLPAHGLRSIPAGDLAVPVTGS
jgi:hypothetical protein